MTARTEPIDLWIPEREAAAGGALLICGVDEAGAGPLAGPVCAAAVILPPEAELPGLDDSKKLSEKRREALFPLICATAVAWSVAWASHQEIDAINILNARMLAMKRAVEALAVRPDCALIDGNRCPALDIPCKAIVGGDGESASIAAASSLAKVSRDRHMLKMAETYPGYGFERHKGYPTAVHYEALRALGSCPIHRLTFLRNV